MIDLFPPRPFFLPFFFQLFYIRTQILFPSVIHNHSWLVAVVHALGGNSWEPRRVSAIVIDEVIGSNPHELVALVHIELRQCWLIPPEPFLTTAAAFFGIIGTCNRRWALTCINFKALV